MATVWDPPKTALAPQVELERERERLRWHSLALLGVIVLYQWRLALSAAAKVAFLSRMLGEFGGTTPAITSALIAAVPYWPAVPSSFMAAGIFIWRKPRASILVTTLVLGAAAAAAAIMDAWLIDGYFAPLMALSANVQ